MNKTKLFTSPEYHAVSLLNHRLDYRRQPSMQS